MFARSPCAQKVSIGSFRCRESGRGRGISLGWVGVGKLVRWGRFDVGRQQTISEGGGVEGVAAVVAAVAVAAAVTVAAAAVAVGVATVATVTVAAVVLLMQWLRLSHRCCCCCHCCCVVKIYE
jgi:fatty acid desaturase